MNGSKPDGQYAVLSPWADVDPVPLKGISAPRLDDLSGKKIGLLCNFKPAARPILKAVEDKLKARYPTCELIWYSPTVNIAEIIGTEKAKFEEWINAVHAVVLAVGD